MRVPKAFYTRRVGEALGSLALFLGGFVLLIAAIGVCLIAVASENRSGSDRPPC
jgi:hypothetical protein